MEVLYHHLRNKGSKRRNNKSNANANSNPKKSKTSVNCEELMPLLENIPRNNELDDSRDDYFNDSI